MHQATVRRRLQVLRERRNLSQADLSQAMGFSDRQTLSDIELGKRNIAPAELVRAAHFLEVGIDYFSDPLELAGEACFSWRKINSHADDLESFENRAGRWIATYRHLGRMKGESVNSSLTRVGLTAKSFFEEAEAEGDAVSRALGLGDVPAVRLASVLEDKLDTLVLLVDTVSGVSGAACRLGPLNTIIINRRESEGRRSFDMGHELFHLITWQDMPPPHVETSGALPRNYKRIEQLADHFAAGLLMPVHAVKDWVGRSPVPMERAGLSTWIRDGATHFHVSGQAFKWRLVNMGLLKKVWAEKVEDAEIRTDCSSGSALLPRFSRRFVETLGWGIDEGHLSVRRAADIVCTSVDDLADLFSEHGLKTPFDL